ncbi:hypothetical protein LY76DRAFT_601678 [Colletotrichum caudatum]|nr:hypothetical protein LY76DRAFT_601678 [Colletotrichum caudatum]
MSLAGQKPVRGEPGQQAEETKGDGRADRYGRSVSGPVAGGIGLGNLPTGGAFHLVLIFLLPVLVRSSGSGNGNGNGNGNSAQASATSSSISHHPPHSACYVGIYLSVYLVPCLIRRVQSEGTQYTAYLTLDFGANW